MNLTPTARNLGITPRKQMTQSVILEAVVRRVGYGDLPYNAMVAAHGIMWALSSGRLSAEQQMKIERLSAYQTCKLIDTLVNLGVTTEGAVKDYLKGMK